MGLDSFWTTRSQRSRRRDKRLWHNVLARSLCYYSVTGLDNIESVTVIDDYNICSDHLPLRVVVRCDLATNHHCVSGRNRNDFIDWKTAGVHDNYKFDVKSSEYLSNVDVSVSLYLTALINRVSYMKMRLIGCMEILSKT